MSFLCTREPFTAVFLHGQLFFCCWRDWFKDQWKVDRMVKAAKESKDVPAPKKNMPSKQWSCSELQEGHAKLLKCKNEKLSPDEMQQQIEEAYHNNILSCFLEIFECNPNRFTYIKSIDASNIKTHKHNRIMCSAPSSGLRTSAGCFEEGLIRPVCEWASSIQSLGEDGIGWFPLHISITLPFHKTNQLVYRPNRFMVVSWWGKIRVA